MRRWRHLSFRVAWESGAARRHVTYTKVPMETGTPLKGGDHVTAMGGIALSTTRNAQGQAQR